MSTPIRICLRQYFVVLCLLLSSLFSFAQNAVYTENQNVGNPISEWGVPSFRDARIAGFGTRMSYTAGQTVHFKISSQGNAPFTLKIYRLGYYNNAGARLMDDLGTLAGTQQPDGINDPVLGLYDCNNWSESAQWAIPPGAVSGLYIAKIVRNGVMADGSNHVVFIVRNDVGNSDLLMQFSDATWQAYNGYGGTSLYDGTTDFPNGHAAKVSYNRPFFVYNSVFDTNGRMSDWYMNSEYPMLRWLEKNGYDVSYTTNEDISANASHLLNHKVFLTVGHDEYWSKEERTNIEAARDAGVHLAFFTGNDAYWKTRWEADANGTNFRTLVCYKEGFLGDGSIEERACGSKCDATSPEWTGLWRTGGDYDAGKPENLLTGTIGWVENPTAISVPSEYKKLRFWNNTSVAGLANGQTATMAPTTLGYEWNYEQYFDFYPAGRFTMSKTTLDGKTHKLSLYRAPSGALVFGAGTIQWSWGLDGNHFGGAPTISKDMQQATVNLFADMGSQPFSLQPDLIAASQTTDAVAPTSVIVTPPGGATFIARSVITIAGTATDAGGGVVAGVDVSTDGGTTWRAADMSAADGNITWSYSWTPTTQGTVVIKTRSVDDSGNKEVPGAGTAVNVTPPTCPCTIMLPDAAPANVNANSNDPARELGVRFRPNVSGTISAIRFYKASQNNGTHIGSIWTSTGTLLGQVTFTGETATGWQQATLATPIAVTAGTIYVASYTSTSGYFSSTYNFFTTDYPAGPTSSWPIQAPAHNAPTQLNGVYVAASIPTFPTESGEGTNYFVDVVFNDVAPVTATLNGTVALEGRGAAPSANWQIPVTLDFYAAGNTTTPAFTRVVLLDQNGNFIVPSIPTASYSVTIRNAHSLMRVKANQVFVAGVNTIDFGTLLEGDLNGDNIVDFVDFSILGLTYNKVVGDAGYNAAADMNGDGAVDFADFSILSLNYNHGGDTL